MRSGGERGGRGCGCGSGVAPRRVGGGGDVSLGGRLVTGLNTLGRKSGRGGVGD